MDFARLRPRVAVLLTSGALALAALLAGGCSSPDSDERAQFVSVSGVVLSATGAPVPGAEVFVVPAVARGTNATSANGPIGTRNFAGQLAPASVTSQVGPFPNGLIGPFPVDPRTGAFTIPAVKASPDLANPVVLNIVAWAPGFQPVLATVPAPATQTIAGRAFTQGVATTDIVVTGSGVNEVSAVLAAPAVVGNTVTVGVTGASIGSNNANLTINPSVLTTPTDVTVTGLNQGQVGVFTAAPPQTIPAAGQNVPPSSVAFGQTGASVIPLGGLSVSAPGVTSFGTGPTGSIALPVSGLGSSVRVLRFNPLNGTWSLVTGSSISGGNVVFPVTQPGVYVIAIDSTWTIGQPVASTVPADTILFPPIASLPNGYTVVGQETANNTFSNFISFPTVPSDLANLLAAGYSALTGDVASTTPVPFVDQVPPGTTTGRSCTKNTIAVTVSIDAIASLANIHGTRQLWICKDVTTAVVPTVPTHLQGHIQGGGTGF